MEKQAFEPTGLIPRSIIRTVDRFVQQLLPGREKIALQEYRVSRYQILVSIKSLLTLVLIPILVSSTMKALLFTPLVEHFWNNNQSEIFLNQYQEKRAFSEMHDFSEKMFFESLLIEPKIKSNPLEIENLDTRNILNPPYSTVFYANELGTKHSKNQSINPFCSLYVARTKAHSLHQHVLCKLPRCVAPPYKAPLCTHHFWSPVQSSALQGDALCKAPLCKAHSLQSGALHGMRLRIAPSAQSKAKHFFLQSEALYAKQRKERGEVCKERIFARQMPTGQERKSSDLKRFDIPICNSIFSNTFLESETLSGQVLQTKSKKPIAYKALLCKPFKKGLQSRALYRSVNDAVHLPTFVAYKAELCTYKQSDRSLANDAPLNLQFPKTINISSDLQYSSTLLQRSFDSRFSHVRAFATSTELFQGLQSGALYAKRSFPFAPTKLDAFPHPRLYKPIRFASANFVSCCKGTYNKAPLCEVHVLCKPCHVATPVTLQGGTVCIGELCNGFTNPKGHQGFVLSTLLPLRDAPNHVRGLQSGALYVQRKERGCRALSLRPKRSFGKPLQTVNLQRTWLANPKGEQSFATGCISKQTGFVPILYDNNNKLLSYSHFTENDKYETLFQRKSLELAKSYNKQSILAITNLLGDFLTFFTVSVLFRIMRPELIILKSFLTESVYSLSDTTKSFLLILGMDLLVGFHSPRGWELLLEGFLRHIGLPENENFILLFVALFPVFLDTVFKYWIFRYLNKISPSTVVTYHSMIE